MTSNLNYPTRQNKNNDLQNWKIFKEKRLVRRIRRPYTISSVVLVVIIFSCIGYNYFANSNEQLFNRNFECYNIGNDRMFNHMQAIRKYKEKDFEKAVELFTELYIQDSILGSNAFYLAISHIKCENYYVAIDLLEKIALDKNNVYRNNSYWYLGLCYLKLYRNDEARKCFERIINSESEYTSNAKRILTQMRN